MAIDLSALDEAPIVASPKAAPAKQVKTAPRAPIGLFVEDADQPRTEFDDVEFEEFCEDVKEHGILQPLVVIERADGKLLIRFGARRFRAGTRLGLTELPYVVTEDPRQLDDYAQVSENERRKGLQPLELANFIAKRLKAGDKKKTIASKLKIDPSAVTHLLALTDAPPFLLELYHSRKCRTAQYLYTLRNLHTQNPELVENRTAAAEEIDRAFLAALSEEVAPSKPATTTTPPESGALKDPLDNIKGDSEGSSGDGDSSHDAPDDPGTGGPDVQHIPAHNPDLENDPPGPSDPDKLKKPLLLAKFGDKEVMVVLKKRPSSAGLVFIRYEDSNLEEEVNISDVVLTLLTDSKV
ncbi:ParB/RepB/Spo0J family partition protein [Variovorax guangxiensis]|uniref:ParB/RepB/Spo0J family partition protein n=1 Tax=Variovorax guangxiensis TaxID=1775474 RepID=A0A3S0ZFF3_9BURK|nr:ParB/RepB/Spo0J family partition protein [Variovorax guangxiensis]RUR71859.1 ParB/RepB/Spo0J family partition protein [Variovorax guangxiensis]